MANTGEDRTGDHRPEKKTVEEAERARQAGGVEEGTEPDQGTPRPGRSAPLEPGEALDPDLHEDDDDVGQDDPSDG